MRRLDFLLLSLVVLLAGACGSGGVSRPATIPKPDIAAVLTHDIFFGSGTSAPAAIEVQVHNRASVPINIRRVELSSPGMTQYGILPIAREFRQAVGPGETKAVTVFATAVTTVRHPNEPLAIRSIVHFESGGVRWREVILSQQ